MSPEEKAALLTESQHLREMFKENARARYRKPATSFCIITGFITIPNGEKKWHVSLIGGNDMHVFIRSNLFPQQEMVKGIHEALVNLFERVQNEIYCDYVETEFSSGEGNHDGFQASDDW